MVINEVANVDDRINTVPVKRLLAKLQVAIELIGQVSVADDADPSP